MSSAPLYLHIGLQKTGTSYLQSIFWRNQTALAAAGLDMVPASKRATFDLMLNVRERYRPEFDSPEAADSLKRLRKQLSQAEGTRALMSEESLAPASHEQIRRLLDECRDREVHLIVTVRDLARQIPSAWQQKVQSGSKVAFSQYLRKLRRQHDKGVVDSLWRNKDVPAILARWQEHIPAEQIHIITVPQAGGDRTTLLRRYCSVLSVDFDMLDLEVTTPNESLGRPQVEVLRRVNRKLSSADRRRDLYGDVGKRGFAMGILSPQKGERTVLPPELQPWCTEISREYVAYISQQSFDITGDVAELLGANSSFAEQSVSKAEIADVAVKAVAALLSRDMRKLRQRRTGKSEAAQSPSRGRKAVAAAARRLKNS